MQSVGPYVLVEQLGQGSLTEAWRAVRAADGPDGVFCVLKRPMPALAAERAYQSAFHQLALAAVAVRHPALVTAYEAGDTGPIDPLNPGTAWQVQELVVGTPLPAVLNQLLQRTRDIPRAFALHVCGQVLSGLAHAHRQGASPGSVIHGDVCPAAVLVAADGRVLLSDLGLGRARLALALPANLGQRYRFQYMAPETARDGVQDWRSDLYAVGIMMHEMLSMRRLRKGATPDELRQQAMAGTWPALETLGVPTDDGLNAILARALQDHPAARYPTADAFLADLASYVQMRNLVVQPQHVQQLMLSAFPGLVTQEDDARRRARDVFNAGAPSVATVQEAAALPPVPGEPPAPEPTASSPPGRPRVATGARPASTDPGLARKAALWGGALVVAAVAILGGINAMRHGSKPGAVQGRASVPVRDHGKLVGGRPALFWSERLSQVDKALAVARAAERADEVARLTALREDLVRKATALGLPEIASAGNTP